MKQAFRLTPLGPTQLYQTYQLAKPRATHTRAATCQEVDCLAYLVGWRTVLDLNTELGREQARYIREQSGRSFRDVTTDPERAAGTLVLAFAAGQRCFGQHRVDIGREPMYLIKPGDHRMPTDVRTRRLVTGDEWLDRFSTNLDDIAQRQQRG